MKTTLEKITALKSMVESMGNFKNGTSNRDKEMFENSRDQAGKLIDEMNLENVMHPEFSNLVVSFDYWK